MPPRNMEKLCECGCGNPAPLASKTLKARGWIKGQPIRFIAGHKPKGPKNPRWKGVACVCLLCGKTFYREPSSIADGRGKFCGNPCKYKHKSLFLSGENSHAWKGGVRTDKDGYVFININGSYVKRATIVCESINGTKLKSGDVVHHINGVKDDDRPENLTAMTRLEHNRLHGKLIKGKRGKKVKSVCLTCGSTIIAAPSANRKYCNHSCAAKHLKPRLGTGKPK